MVPVDAPGVPLRRAANREFETTSEPPRGQGICLLWSAWTAHGLEGHDEVARSLDEVDQLVSGVVGCYPSCRTRIGAPVSPAVLDVSGLRWPVGVNNRMAPLHDVEDAVEVVVDGLGDRSPHAPVSIDRIKVLSVTVGVRFQSCDRLLCEAPLRHLRQRLGQLESSRLQNSADGHDPTQSGEEPIGVFADKGLWNPEIINHSAMVPRDCKSRHGPTPA